MKIFWIKDKEFGSARGIVGPERCENKSRGGVNRLVYFFKSVLEIFKFCFAQRKLVFDFI